MKNLYFIDIKLVSAVLQGYCTCDTPSDPGQLDFVHRPSGQEAWVAVFPCPCPDVTHISPNYILLGRTLYSLTNSRHLGGLLSCVLNKKE